MPGRFYQLGSNGDAELFFHHDRLREQNVVLEMDVTVQVFFEIFETGLEAGVAVLFSDLDRFKNINDSLGHLVGD